MEETIGKVDDEIRQFIHTETERIRQDIEKKSKEQIRIVEENIMKKMTLLCEEKILEEIRKQTQDREDFFISKIDNLEKNHEEIRKMCENSKDIIGEIREDVVINVTDIKSIDRDLKKVEEKGQRLNTAIEDLDSRMSVSEKNENTLNDNCKTLWESNKELSKYVSDIMSGEIKIGENSQSNRTQQVRFESPEERDRRSSTRLRSTSPISRIESSYKNALESIGDLTRRMNESCRTGDQIYSNMKLPIFKATANESPMLYLKNVRTYINLTKLSGEEMKYALSNSLLGTAASWWQTIEEKVINFQRFEEAFRKRYWSNEIMDSVTRRIESGRYSPNREKSRVEYATDLYIFGKETGKYTEEELIRKLANHYEMDVKFAIKSQNVVDFDRFVELLEYKDKTNSYNDRKARENGSINSKTGYQNNKNNDRSQELNNQRTNNGRQTTQFTDRTDNTERNVDRNNEKRNQRFQTNGNNSSRNENFSRQRQRNVNSIDVEEDVNEESELIEDESEN